MITRLSTQDDDAQVQHLWQERLAILSQSDPRFLALMDAPMPEDLTVFIAQSEGHILGCIACQIRDDYGVILDIALDAHTYHSGLGRTLLQGAKDWFHQQQPTSLKGIVARVPLYHAVEQAFWRALGAKNWTEAPWQTAPQYHWMML
jgi:N-acetylglutamate synthase-like GNAT family acetyltransferase